MFCRIFLITFIFVIYCFGDIFEPVSVPEYDEKKALLGKELFFDNKLSAKKRSCQTCHHLKGELTGTVNETNSSYSILNSSLNFFINEKGEFYPLKEKIISQFFDKKLYDTDPVYFLEEIKKNPSYVKMFKEIYEELDFANAVDALSEFILALRSPARFDDYLLGDENALSKEEKEGFEIFVSKGCALCHGGPNLGGSMNIHATVNEKEMQLQIPSLRNVLKTKPWSSVYSDDLIYTVLQLKLNLIDINMNEDEMKKIIVFFGALNSKTPSILKE